MSSSKKVLVLEELQNPVAGRVELAGVTHDVRQIDFATHQALDAADGTADSLTVLRDAVSRVVPTLSQEQLNGLNLDQARAILMLSGSGVDAVEAMFPNAVRPETVPTSPA